MKLKLPTIPSSINKRTLSIIFISIVFFLGMYIYCTERIRVKTINDFNIESLQNRSKKSPPCPNVLVKRGSNLYLYNTTDRSDSIPIHFNNLDEYISYAENQQAQGSTCPILFLQQENDTQGNDVYRVRPSPFDLQSSPNNEANAQAIMDASRDGTLNSNLFQGFDPYGQSIGIFNELDVIHHSTSKVSISDNPMDTNWGGVEHTQGSVDSGKYEKRQVTKPTYFTPSDEFTPGLGNRNPPNSFISSSGTAI